MRIWREELRCWMRTVGLAEDGLPAVAMRYSDDPHEAMRPIPLFGNVPVALSRREGVRYLAGVLLGARIAWELAEEVDNAD